MVESITTHPSWEDTRPILKNLRDFQLFPDAQPARDWVYAQSTDDQ